MAFSGTSMAEDFPGTTMGFSFTADTTIGIADPYEDSLSTECDYVKWQSSQTACQALNHLIMTSANEPMLKVRLKEDELGIATDSKGWQRQPSFDQIPGFSLLSTNDGPSTSFGPSSKPSSSSSSKPSTSSRPLSSKPSSRPPRSRPRPSETKSRPSNKPIATNPDSPSSSALLNKTNPEHLLDVIKCMKTHVEQKAAVQPRRNSTAGSVASSSTSSTRVVRTSTTNAAVAVATAATTRKRARNASDGRNSSSDGMPQQGQAKRGRVVLDKGKARASVDSLEMRKGQGMVKEKEKDVHISPPRFLASAGAASGSSSGSGTASSSSGSSSRRPEGSSDTSLSMAVDEGDISLADRSTRSWTTDSPSLLGSSSSLSSAESKSPSQKRMPPPPVPLGAKLLAANGHQSRRRSSGGGGSASSSRPAATSSTILVPTQKETNLNAGVVPRLHPLLQNPPTKPSAPIISNSTSYAHSSGRPTKVNPRPHQAPPRVQGSRQTPAVPFHDIPPRVVTTISTSNATTTTKVKLEPQPQPQVQAQPPVPLRTTTSCKPSSGGTSTSTSTSTARTSNAATTAIAGRTATTNLSSTPYSGTQSQPQHLTLSQSTRPPALGMRRTNTFPTGGMGTGVGVQKTGALPTKQKGFRVPFMNGGVGSQQQQQRQPSVVDSGAPGQGGASTSNALKSRPVSTTASFSFASSATSKPANQPSAQTVLAPTVLAPAAPASPPPVSSATVPAILPGPTDGDGDSSFDMSLSFDMDALEETMKLYD